MKKRIIILGDSFTYGHGCADRVFYWDEKKQEHVGWFFKYPEDGPSIHSWPSLLMQDIKEYDIVNLARPGNSNQHMFGQLMSYFYNFEEHVELVVFSATFCNRVEAASMRDPERADPWCIAHDHKMGNEEDWYKDAKQSYVKYLYNGQIGINQTLSALLGAHSATTSRGIKFLWSIPKVALPMNMRTLLAPIIKQQMKNIYNFDYSGKKDAEFNSTCYCPDTHTNEKGHKLYYHMEALPAIRKVLNNE